MTKEELKKVLEKAIRTLTGKKDKTMATAVYGDVVVAKPTGDTQDELPTPVNTN